MYCCTIRSSSIWNEIIPWWMAYSIKDVHVLRYLFWELHFKFSICLNIITSLTYWIKEGGCTSFHFKSINHRAKRDEKATAFVWAFWHFKTSTSFFLLFFYLKQYLGSSALFKKMFYQRTSQSNLNTFIIPHWLNQGERIIWKLMCSTHHYCCGCVSRT